MLGNLAEAKIGIGTGFLLGDRLLLGRPNGITGNYSERTGQLALTGIATAATYQDALQSISYSSKNRNTNPRTVTWFIRSANGVSAEATSTVEINVPPAPQIEVTGRMLDFTSGGAPKKLELGITVGSATNTLTGAGVAHIAGQTPVLDQRVAAGMRVGRYSLINVPGLAGAVRQDDGNLLSRRRNRWRRIGCRSDNRPNACRSQTR